jgi:hypothetical protein
MAVSIMAGKRGSTMTTDKALKLILEVSHVAECAVPSRSQPAYPPSSCRNRPQLLTLAAEARTNDRYQNCKAVLQTISYAPAWSGSTTMQQRFLAEGRGACESSLWFNGESWDGYPQ